MADKENLMVIIGAKADELKSALNDAQGSVSTFGSKLKTGLKTAGVALAAVGTAAIGAGVASVKSFADAGDEIQKLALKTGFSTESISELKYAAELSGASIDTVSTGIKGLSNFMQLLGQGSSTAADDMAALGLSAEQLQGLTAEETFNLMAEAIAGIEDPLEKAAIAQDVFGKSGIELLPMLTSGAEGLEAMKQEARDLGLVFSQDAADSAAAFNDALTELQGAFSGIMNQVGSALIPALMPLIDTLTELVKALPLEQIGELIGKLLPPLADALLTVLEAIPIDAVISFVGDALSPLLAILPPIFEALSPIFEILGKILSVIPIKQFMELVTGVITPLLIPALQLIATVLDAISPVLDVVFGLLGKIFEILQPILDLITNILSGIIGGVGDVLGNIFGGISSGISWVGDLLGIGDGIVQNGRVITTDPADYIIATKEPQSLLPAMSGGGTLGVLQPSYVFNVSFPDMVVRSEADIDEIANKLQRLYERAQRTGG